MFLGSEYFYAAKVLAVADDHDLAAHIDLQLLQLLEIFGRAVVRVNHIGLDVA